MQKYVFTALLVLSALGQCADKSGDLVAQAAQAESAEQYDHARELYRSATEQFPDSAEAWAAYGEHLRFYAHDEEAAKSAFQKAIEAHDASAHASAFAWRGLAEISAKNGKISEAIEQFEHSLSAEPLADTHRSLCHLYCGLHDFESAARHAAAAVKLNPNDPIARLLYAAQLERVHKFDDARENFNKALQIAKIDAEGNGAEHVHCCVFYNASGYLAVAGDKKRALKMLRKFFETPNHRHLTRREIESDADFSALKADPDFQSLVEQYLPDESHQPATPR